MLTVICEFFYFDEECPQWAEVFAFTLSHPYFMRKKLDIHSMHMCYFFGLNF